VQAAKLQPELYRVISVDSGPGPRRSKKNNLNNIHPSPALADPRIQCPALLSNGSIPWEAHFTRNPRPLTEDEALFANVIEDW